MTDPSPPTPSPPAAVVFDVDGTLVDSERDGHRVAFNDAFAAHELPYRWSEQAYGDLLDVAGGRRRLRAFLIGQGYDEQDASSLAASLHAHKNRRVQELIGEGRIPPRPGAQRLVRELAAADVTLTVATTGSRAWVEPLLERNFSDITFALVLTGDEVPDRKPDPAIYHRTVRALDLAPASVLVIEDSGAGAAAAAAAGLRCLVVVNDYTRDDDLADAALVVDGFGTADAPAAVLAGNGAALDDGLVTAATCAALLG